MRLKLRLPSGTSICALTSSATVKELRTIVAKLDNNFTTDSNIEVKVSFPPKVIDLSDDTQLLIDVGVKTGDLLIVSLSNVNDTSSSSVLTNNDSTLNTGNAEEAPPPYTKPKGSLYQELLQSEVNEKEIAQSQDSKTTPPKIDLNDGQVILRVMEDDNSCLFRAIGYCVLGKIDTMIELRHIVADAIRKDPIEYSDAILGKPRNEYITWILQPTSWGGAIEIAILAEHLGITINSFDVSTGRVDTFNPDAKSFCNIIYSGIHYDAVAYTPATGSGEGGEFDATVFGKLDQTGIQVMVATDDLVSLLKVRHYYTDTANYTIKCNVCNQQFKGNSDATKHANQSGHYEFVEC